MPSSKAVPEFQHDDLANLTVAVAGLGPYGMSALDVLHHLGAAVIGFDERDIAPEQQERAEILTYLGLDLRPGRVPEPELLDSIDLVILTESWMAGSALVTDARARGIEIWSDAQLAWRIRPPEAAPWLLVAGARGKTTTAHMVERIFHSAGVRAKAVGDGCWSLLEAVADPEGPSVVIVEMSELHLSLPTTISPASAVVVNSPESPFGANPFDGVQIACIYNAHDEQVRELVERADVVEGARAVAFSFGTPAVGDIGMVEDLAVDRAFVANRRLEAEELFTIEDLGDVEPHIMLSALAASALARSVGVRAEHVKTGLAEFSRSSK